MNKTTSLPSGALSRPVTKICRVTGKGNCARKFARKMRRKTERRNSFPKPFVVSDSQ